MASVRVLHRSRALDAPNLPPVGSQAALSDVEWLATAYAEPPAASDRPWIRANFVSSIDGAVSGRTGLAADLHTPADNAAFAVMRALCDVVLVGAGTIRAEGYGRIEVDAHLDEVRRAAGFTSPPALAIVTASGDVPEKVRHRTPRQGEVHVLQGDPVTGDEARARLVDLGYRHILCEGGPHLLHAMISSGVIDEVCITTYPGIVGGDGPRLVTGSSLHARLTPGLVLEHDGTLLTRWLRG